MGGVRIASGKSRAEESLNANGTMLRRSATNCLRCAFTAKRLNNTAQAREAQPGFTYPNRTEL